MGEKYAYARVSTQDQHVDRQIENIKKYCPDIDDDHLFIEKISGKRGMDDRQEYSVLRRVLRSGDELIIDALDRLGRRKADIKAELEYLRNKGVILRILLIPTTLMDVEGQAWVMEMINNLLIEVYSSIAEQELSEKERRQRDGIEAAWYYDQGRSFVTLPEPVTELKYLIRFLSPAVDHYPVCSCFHKSSGPFKRVIHALFKDQRLYPGYDHEVVRQLRLFSRRDLRAHFLDRRLCLLNFRPKEAVLLEPLLVLYDNR